MDTSEIRIKMCEMATEIQDSWVPKVGDWFYKRDGMGFGLWLIANIRADGVLECAGERMNQAPFIGKLVPFMTPEYYIWLPCQDRLQEMLRDLFSNRHLPALVEKFALFTKFGGSKFTSMEQLWLGFTMYENHGKVWKSDDWIKHSP